MSEVTLVLGATGGTGTHIVHRLVELNRRVRVLVRDTATAEQLFPDRNLVEIRQGNVQIASDLKSAVQGVTYIINTLGPRARPSLLGALGFGESSNHPSVIEEQAMRIVCLAAKAQGNVKHITLITSGFVSRPFSLVCILLNLLADMTMRHKFMAECVLRQSGIPYTIIRPAGLVDHQDVQKSILVVQGDRLPMAKICRKTVALLAVRTIMDSAALWKTFEMAEGNGGVWDKVPLENLKKDDPVDIKSINQAYNYHYIMARGFIWTVVSAVSFGCYYGLSKFASKLPF
jgi:hypothetical protein